jgi:hypothetical protein
MNGVYMSKENGDMTGDKSYEDESPEYAHEAHEFIAKKLNQIIQNAKGLLHACQCKSEELIEPEAQESIILACDHLDSVHDYVMSEDSYEESGQESKMPVGFVVAVEQAMTPNGRSTT